MPDRNGDDSTSADRGGRSDDGHSVDGDDASDSSFSFTLPPIRLPPFFPEDFRLLWPAAGEKLHGRVSRRVVLGALVAFDLLDAFLATTTDSAVVAGARVVGGALVAATTFGTVGVAYVWEAGAVLVGGGEVTVLPTLTVLLIARALRDVL
jgi:hypothetical protein